MVEMKVPEYRYLYKSEKGYHLSWDAAWEALGGNGGKVQEVVVLVINEEYYPLPESIDIWNKWQDSEYD
jgi:hypothetical protein